MSHTILVTGGAGYIGGIAVELLLEEGFKVVILDNLTTGHKDTLFQDIPFYKSDIGDKNTLKKIFSENQIDAVMHFAASALVEESINNPFKYYENNFCQAQNLLDEMILFDVKKIVFSSSCAIYGIPKSEEIPIKEETETKPINPYGESKLLFEKALEWFKTTYGLDYISVRYFNIAGSSKKLGEKHSPETHLIPLVLKASSDQNYRLQIYGNDYPTNDGTAIRDYVHILDLIDVHIKALKKLLNKEKYLNIYNVGYGHGYSVLEIVNAAKEVLKKEINYKISPRRPGDPPVLIADSTKIRKDFNWRPKYDNIHEIILSASKFII